jgi:hypothetical protein
VLSHIVLRYNWPATDNDVGEPARGGNARPEGSKPRQGDGGGAMSLSAREEQILGSIEDGLARSDPRLAWMLAIFTRLVSGEEMPVREKIHAVRLVANLRARRPPRPDIARRRARRLYQRLGLPQYWALWLAAVVAVALVAVALVVSHGGSGSGQGSCTASWPAVCTAQASAHPAGSKGA